ncbi:MFS transporter [Leuconostoc suionicum]|uniref:MFS transporter n=1 Tax=Leuconostoc suionicum TaxID=1511761 RepID=UPI001B8A9383|nr:MFS transporter [Leuconostoc suionicum]MBS1007452.1 MFS transporter [Leuconostoc suionicum]
MVKQDSLLTKIAFLGISFVLTSAYAINGALPQMTEALHISSTEAQVLATTPSITVTIFVLLSSFIAAKLGDKNTIILGVTLVGIAGIIPFFTDSYVIILASRTVLGAGFGIFNSLAVSMIAVMYNGKTRSSMLGYRAAAEQVGQAVLTLLAGLLLAFGWHATFLVYLIAFPILFLFIKRVPDTSEMTPLKTETTDSKQVEEVTRISPLVLVLTLFAAFLVIDYMAIQLSFPFMAADLKGDGYNTSPILSAMLIAATIGGVTYGWFMAKFGRFTLQIGLVLMAISNFLVAFSNGNFGMLILGVLLIGFPLQLISPFIFNQLPKLAPLARQSLVTSIILIGFNVGVFIEPIVVAAFAKLIGHGGGSAASSAYATIPYLGSVLLIIAIITVITNRKQEK